MTEPDGYVEATAALLRAAYVQGPIAPLRSALGTHDVDSAYAIQACNTAYWTSQGRRIVGRKIGLTAESVQRQLGVEQPDFGVLFEDMRIPTGGTLSRTQLLQGKVEAEIAFVLARDLTADAVTPDEMLASIAFVTAALEIVDSRIADWKITIADTIADNASSAFFVLGDIRRAPADFDFERCTMSMTVDGRESSTGSGRACLGSPLNSASWLANTLAARGEPLRAGDIVLTGALGPMVKLEPDTLVEAAVSGLGTVNFRVQ